MLTGSATGTLLAQQTAANLHAVPGTKVDIGRPGLPPVSVPVDGVVDLPAADSLFQAVGAPAGTAPQAPPDNVVLLPAALWQQVFGPVAAVHPEAVRTQLHVGLSRSLLPDPAAAFAEVGARARNLEARLTGQAIVGDNLAARLDATRSDAVYVQLLFLLLGIPGVAVAALLAGVAGAAGRTRRRQDHSCAPGGRPRGRSSGWLRRRPPWPAPSASPRGSAAPRWRPGWPSEAGAWGR